MNNFKFSIILIISHSEIYLEDAIKSIINQDIGFEDNVELILVDQINSNESIELINYYQTNYPNNILFYSVIINGIVMLKI